MVKEIYKILLNLKKQTDMKAFTVNRDTSNCMGKNSMLRQHKKGICIKTKNKFQDFLKYATTYMHRV